MRPTICTGERGLVDMAIFPAPRFFSRRVPYHHLSAQQIITAMPQILSAVFGSRLPKNYNHEKKTHHHLNALPTGFVGQAPSGRSAVFQRQSKRVGRTHRNGERRSGCRRRGQVDVRPFRLYGGSRRYYKGGMAGLGFSYGYAWLLSKRWNVTAEIGIGVFYMKDTRRDRIPPEYESIFIHHYKRWVVGPSRAEISFNYLF